MTGGRFFVRCVCGSLYGGGSCGTLHLGILAGVAEVDFRDALGGVLFFMALPLVTFVSLVGGRVVVGVEDLTVFLAAGMSAFSCGRIKNIGF